MTEEAIKNIIKQNLSSLNCYEENEIDNFLKDFNVDAFLQTKFDSINDICLSNFTEIRCPLFRFKNVLPVCCECKFYRTTTNLTQCDFWNIPFSVFYTRLRRDLYDYFLAQEKIINELVKRYE